MGSLQNQDRIKAIYRMLLALANGNLGYRMVLDGADESFDELATLLNQLAEKLEEMAYYNPYLSRKTDLGLLDDSSLLLVRKVLDYIYNNLEEPLPSTRKLARMFGTNEFALKNSFRRLQKTSIYQFYNDERLKKAHLLIEDTTLPFKDIALCCGFSDYPTFLKAFKRKYHYPPTMVKRENGLNRNT
ncbi:hypothetical protein GCM10022386_08300 [Flavobacterium cheonhonense]|jgi:transcriptional regulator GlxA family with amidase domain|uniref:AraC family transcriptional regulator n=1 Tax=Flavobacterium cheonhonense TaxID=706185 RepID=A0ABP7TJX2_9FLAO|nr:helix-turn-helix domain-containing protein [Flavobacterium cheonhonense]